MGRQKHRFCRPFLAFSWLVVRQRLTLSDQCTSEAGFGAAKAQVLSPLSCFFLACSPTAPQAVGPMHLWGGLWGGKKHRFCRPFLAFSQLVVRQRLRLSDQFTSGEGFGAAKALVLSPRTHISRTHNRRPWIPRGACTSMFLFWVSSFCRAASPRASAVIIS